MKKTALSVCIGLGISYVLIKILKNKKTLTIEEKNSIELLNKIKKQCNEISNKEAKIIISQLNALSIYTKIEDIISFDKIECMRDSILKKGYKVRTVNSKDNIIIWTE